MSFINKVKPESNIKLTSTYKQASPSDDNTKGNSPLVDILLCCCSMNVFLPTILILQTALAVVIVFVTGIVSTNFQINMLATQYADVQTTKFEADAQRYLAEFPSAITTLLADYQMGYIDLNKRYELALNMAIRFRNYPDVYEIYFGLPGDVFVGALIEGGNLRTMITNTTHTNWIYFADLDKDSMTYFTPWKAAYPYRPTTRPWYKTATANPNQLIWSSIYYFGFDTLGISLTYAIHNGTAVQGVAAIDFTLDQLSQRLKKTNISENGVIFVMEHNGNLVASSRGAIANETTYTQLTVHESDSELVRAAGDYIKEKYNYVISSDKVTDSFMFGPQKVIIQLLKMKLGDGGLEWTTVILIPENDVMGPIYTVYGIIAAIAVVIIMASAAVVITLTLCISVPLMKLGKQMSDVANMTLQEVGSQLIFIREVVKIQRAFNMMVGKLKEYKAFLPDHILNRDFGEEIQAVEAAQPDPIVSQTPSEKQLDRKSSRPSNERSRRSSSVSSPMATVPNNLFALGVELKDVCMVQVKITNLSSLFHQMSPQDYVPIHGRILDEISRVLTAQRGNLMAFDEKSFTGMWTVTKFAPNARFTKQACTAALDIRNFIDSLNDKEKLGIQFCVIVVKGSCMTGNIGTTKKRIFTAFGDIKTASTNMTYYAQFLKSKVVVDEAVYSQASSSFEFQQLPEMSFNLDISPKFVSKETPNGTLRKTKIYNMISVKDKQQGDEWMYEMQDAAASNQLVLYSQGYQKYQKGEFTQALELLTKLLAAASSNEATAAVKKNTADETVTVLMEMLQHMISRNSSASTQITMHFVDPHVQPTYQETN